jgi:rRNA-processing protein CGR1
MSESVETQAPAADAVDEEEWYDCAHQVSRGLHTLIAFFTGKQWHDNKTAFRPRANQTSWDKRTAERKALAAVKAKEKEMKEEKEAERQVRCCPPSDGSLD